MTPQAERAVRPETRRERRERIRVLAAVEWNSINAEVHPVRHARRHIASLSPEHRARLERDWHDPAFNIAEERN